MKSLSACSTGDLLEALPTLERIEPLASGAAVLRGFARACEKELLGAVHAIISQSPFRHLITPGGYRMSVAMTNCGELGWVSDRSGYRYDPIDPTTQQPWPSMPELFRHFAASAAARAGYETFRPDACLIN